MDSSNQWQNQPNLPAGRQGKKTPTYNNDSVLEALRQVGGGVGKAVVKDVVGKVGSDVLASLFGQVPRSGELFTGQAEVQPTQIRRQEILRPPMVRVEETNLKPQIEAIREQLKMLAVSLKSLSQDVQKAVNEVPVQPGIYHLNFMERLKSILTVLREQIEDSRSWLALSTNRKKQKGYWGMFKKHGTSFGLSSERSIATQAG
ncbi:hypothetical protein A2875_04150 [Candidatus Gottesmanbacteria bacterium RIFCSPHIGHO2_01_FULL_46_14]|uniref:DUF5660 domain-containing protein n=1 Tax=Candidatus Gottesmanbacteria bacterium RIFCSPHIGHO2_01_FULL_46_14 TaxID=1798380 RepID=A0A1F5ZSQ5_9BACT|nr:MAG: hypothetical protein A2875_04150 [Candidatus Gottesmanbacteria bacterium RIFCSPHIGHO2_01_FULL_46_14]